MEKNWSVINGKLGAARKSWRCVRAVAGAFLLVAVLSVIIAAGVSAGAYGIPRIALLSVAALWSVAALGRLVLWPLLRPASLLDVAFMMEKKNEARGGRLSAAVDLYESFRKNEFRGSDEKLNLLMSEASEIAGGASISSAIDLAAMLKKIFMCAAAMAISFGVLFVSGKNIQAAVEYVMPPYMPAAQVYNILWVTGDVTVATGDAAEVFASVESSAPVAPTLELEREGLEPYEIRMKETDVAPAADPGGRKGNVKHYSGRVDSVAGDMTYVVKGPKSASPKYHIFTVQPPVVKNIYLSMKYPEYTGLLPDEKKDSGDVRAPYGTEVTLKVDASSELSAAQILMDGSAIPLKVSGSAATGIFKIEKNVRYSIGITDRNGFRNRFPPEYVVESVDDGPPEIRMLQPDANITISRISELAIRGSAVDDYGVSAVRLQYKIAGMEKSVSEKIGIAPGRNLLFEYDWDLSDVEAYEGDALEYFLCATDNDALKGPKTACSEARKITLLSRFEDFQQARQEQEEVVQGMENLMRDGANISEKFRDLAMSLDKNKPGDRKWMGEAERTITRQEQLEQELKQLSDNMRDSIEQMKNNDLVNLDTLSKMQEINRMMDQIMTEDIRKLIEKVRQNISQANMSNVDRKMLESMADQKKIMDSLEQTLDRLKKIRAEQEMEALKKQLENLSERQERLADRGEELKKNSSRSRNEGMKREMTRQAREQEQVLEETDQTLEAMKELAAELGELSPEQGRKVDGLREVAKKEKLRENMKGAEERLREGDINDAAQKEEAASDTLKKMSEAMNMAGNEYMKEMAAKEKKMAMDLLRRTLDISEAHENVLEENTKALALRNVRLSGDDIEKMISDEKISAETIQKLRKELYTLSVLSMVVQPDVIWYSADAQKNIESSISELGAENPTGAARYQAEALKKLNQLAIALMDAGKRMGMPSTKSAMDDFMDQLQNLAGSQEALNAETQKFGESGIPMPGSGDALSSLAMQQQLISEGLGKLQSEMEKLGENGERLSQIQKEMEKIRKSMLGGDAGQEVQRRQATVLRRLQDASLSLRKESLEEKRVAEKAGEYEVEKPVVRDLLLEALPESVREELNRFRNDPRPEGYERLIERYYNELMRSGE